MNEDESDDPQDQYELEALAQILPLVQRYLTREERRQIRRSIKQRLAELTIKYNSRRRDPEQLEREAEQRKLLGELEDLDIRHHVPARPVRQSAATIQRDIAEQIEGIKRRVYKGGRVP